MNKNLIIGIVIGAVFIVGGYLLFAQSQPKNQEGLSMQKAGEPMMQKSSFKDLLGLGTNQQCTFTDTESQSSGTVYVGKGNARGDFMSQANGAESGSHMIINDQDMYVWTEGAQEGFKMSRSSMEELQKSVPVSDTNPQTVDVNKQVDYSCSSWGVDSSIFTPPADVTFTDYSSMMEDAQNMMESSGANEAMMQDTTAACASCNNLPAEAQAQCKAALKCK